MKAGNLYYLKFPYQEGPGAKLRPVLIIGFDHLKRAVGLKITQTPPNQSFPYRTKVQNYTFAKLRDPSYVQYDNPEPFANKNLKPYSKLHPMDFATILNDYKTFHHR